uniref:Uncharacterized protein n=1 Tax=Megaselia scalaris TaxID=36166 RepID=T1GP22_MEGSC
MNTEIGTHSIHPIEVISSTLKRTKTPESSSCKRSVFCPFGGSEATDNLAWINPLPKVRLL